MVKQWVWKKGNGSSKKEMQKKWLPKKEDKTKKHIDMKKILDYCIPSLNFAKHHLYKKCKDTSKESTNNKSVRFSFTQTQNLETSKVKTGPRWTLWKALKITLPLSAAICRTKGALLCRWTRHHKWSTFGINLKTEKKWKNAKKNRNNGKKQCKKNKTKTMQKKWGFQTDLHRKIAKKQWFSTSTSVENGFPEMPALNNGAAPFWNLRHGNLIFFYKKKLQKTKLIFHFFEIGVKIPEKKNMVSLFWLWCQNSRKQKPYFLSFFEFDVKIPWNQNQFLLFLFVLEKCLLVFPFFFNSISFTMLLKPQKIAISSS